MTPASVTRSLRRGRPRRRVLSLEEVAVALAWPVAALERLLVRCPDTLPGAVRGADGWEVPERALRELLGAATGPLPQMASPAQVAEFLGKSLSQVYRLMKLRDPQSGAPLLPARRYLGDYRIRVEDVLKLPAAYPDWAPSRPGAALFSATADREVRDG